MQRSQELLLRPRDLVALPEPADLKALALTQPWASLMAEGYKTIETRNFRRSHRGWLAIYATKNFHEDAQDTCMDDPFYDDLCAHDYLLHRRDARMQATAAGINLDNVQRTEYNLPLGMVVALVHVWDIQISEGIWRRPSPDGSVWDAFTREREMAYGDYRPGRWCWITNDVLKLPEPVPTRGMPGMWIVEHEAAVRVLEQAHYLVSERGL
jgi:hypothetical protein